MKLRHLLSTLSACILLSSLSSANATIVTVNGDDVSFTYDDATLYGTANVVGNTIFFFPTAFRAESTNGSPSSDSISETLSIEVNATTTGFSMSTFLISEDGDYRVDGSGASVTANGFFRATSLTTPCGFPPCQDEVLMNAGTLASTGTGIAQWSMGGSIDLGNTTGWGSDTSVNLTIQNNLSATTLASGEIAWIEKKFSVTVPMVVPVPAAVWLFGSGLLGLIGIARRKKTA